MPDRSLRQAREFTGLSREKVAAELGISSKTLERWEKGDSPVPRHKLRELAEVYRVQLNELGVAA